MDEMLIQIKRATDQVNAHSEKAQIEANAARKKNSGRNKSEKGSVVRGEWIKKTENVSGE